MKRKYKTLSIAFVLLFIIGGLIYLKLSGRSAALIYDQTHDNPYITTKAELDAVLNSFEKVSYKEMDKDYLKYSKMNLSKYSSMVRSGTFYKIPSDSIYHRIVGKTRIKNLVSKDKNYYAALRGEDVDVYWLLDKRILYKVIELQDELEKMGHNRNAMFLRSGHRHPRRNDEVGGATKSQHLSGKAVDISVQDINRDGKYTEADKKIVLDLAENKIIKNSGGVGLYPGTRAVHLDIRGYRARWNSYSRK